MIWRDWKRALFKFLRPGRRSGRSGQRRLRGPVTHVLILDGTMSSLRPGHETNAGLSYLLLSELENPALSLYYEAGLQWQDWRSAPDVMMGRGINRQIRRAYGYLASRYRPGDRIFLMGYSRGAYAIRSLAGLIDSVGLLKGPHATERNVTTAYRHYRRDPQSAVAARFAARFCHSDAPIEMIGVWDTVKALGLRLPLLWRWAEAAHGFHSHRLGTSIRRGYHALALDERRIAYTPVLWDSRRRPEAEIEQVWFRGSHGDVGGQLNGFHPARPLANIPLVWMLERLEACDVTLPEGWRARFVRDVHAPSVGSWRGWGKLFWLRRARVIGRDPSERIHHSASGPRPGDGGNAKRAI